MALSTSFRLYAMPKVGWHCFKFISYPETNNFLCDVLKLLNRFNVMLHFRVISQSWVLNQEGLFAHEYAIICEG